MHKGKSSWLRDIEDTCPVIAIAGNQPETETGAGSEQNRGTLQNATIAAHYDRHQHYHYIVFDLRSSDTDTKTHNEPQ
ncbi:hypothetical protein ACLKA7_012328 [Drosophila subpalustris]